ncbi:CbtB-domain containing protein [Ferrovibrio sp.]|uniref:CbtB domain-containing protein n=1 Tax=Ferrovibrio sp. TaxID=1917215 RepID=UPI00351349BE
MAQVSTLSRTSTTSIPSLDIVSGLLFGTLMLLMLYFIGIEEGAATVIHEAAIHEFVHDGRHLLGIPCH